MSLHNSSNHAWQRTVHIYHTTIPWGARNARHERGENMPETMRKEVFNAIIRQLRASNRLGTRLHLNYSDISRLSELANSMSF